MKTKTRTTEEKINSQKLKQLGFHKGDVRMFVSNKQSNLRKGKGKQKKTKETPQRVCCKKGLMDKKQRKKWIFEGEDKSKKKQFKTGLLWEQNRKKTLLKMQENNHFWVILYQTQAQKHREKKNKTTKTTKMTKNTFLHSGKPPPIFVKCLFFFYQVTLSHVCKAVFCWKHYKNSAFSRAQLLGITDSNAPLDAPSQNGNSATKSAILGFPLCLLKPLFL